MPNVTEAVLEEAVGSGYCICTSLANEHVFPTWERTHDRWAECYQADKTNCPWLIGCMLPVAQRCDWRGRKTDTIVFIVENVLGGSFFSPVFPFLISISSGTVHSPISRLAKSATLMRLLRHVHPDYHSPVTSNRILAHAYACILPLTTLYYRVIVLFGVFC
jgi:hypothetical protein